MTHSLRISLYALSLISLSRLHSMDMDTIKEDALMLVMTVNDLCSKGKAIKAETEVNAFIAAIQKKLENPSLRPSKEHIEKELQKVVESVRETIKRNIECTEVLGDAEKAIRNIKKKKGVLLSYHEKERIALIDSGKPEYTFLSDIPTPAERAKQVEKFSAFSQRKKEEDEVVKKEDEDRRRAYESSLNRRRGHGDLAF